ncbi:MAG: type II toxin-antitoxin system VapC family toxin [Gammaproteobacteria bacterium]|nr:type II toxin-antitoxin system VapC family toxin [Gammaproteobacteria bacterium]MDE0444967.1 type II toxin-antitoxin system VapC family toxin [Gammaproteobacteria bacterium]
MRYLLDTHVLLWSRASPERLSAEVVALLQSTDNTLYVSMATLWECAIKVCIGKLAVPEGFFRIVANDYEILDIELAHLEATLQLPPLHRDPFDRLLVAQARLGGLTLVTRNRNVMRYQVPVVAA